MPRNKFQKQLDKKQDSNDRAARKLLAKIEGLAPEKKGRVWQINVETSDFYRDLCRRAGYLRMYVTDGQLGWLRQIAKEVAK